MVGTETCTERAEACSVGAIACTKRGEAYSVGAITCTERGEAYSVGTEVCTPGALTYNVQLHRSRMRSTMRLMSSSVVAPELRASMARTRVPMVAGVASEG